jgi:hypothetical protein
MEKIRIHIGFMTVFVHSMNALVTSMVLMRPIKMPNTHENVIIGSPGPHCPHCPFRPTQDSHVVPLWSRTINEMLEVFAGAPKLSTPEVDLITKHFQMETRSIRSSKKSQYDL